MIVVGTKCDAKTKPLRRDPCQEPMPTMSSNPQHYRSITDLVVPSGYVVGQIIGGYFISISLVSVTIYIYIHIKRLSQSRMANALGSRTLLPEHQRLVSYLT